MDEALSRLFADISAYSVLIPIGIGGLRWRKLQLSQRLLLLFLIITVVFELVSFWVGPRLGLNNLPLLHLYTIIQFLFLTRIFELGLIPLISAQRFNWLKYSFLTFALIDMLVFNKALAFNSLARFLESLIFIFFCLTYFYKTLEELKVKRLEKEPLFWISSGLLIYFAGCFLIFIFSNYIVPLKFTTFLIWGIHAWLNTILNLFYAAALWSLPAK